MAATVSPWANKPGAWALDAEQHEEELLQQKEQDTNGTLQNSVIHGKPLADFPSLSAAAVVKPKKKNKGQTLSLAEFTTYSAPKPSQKQAEPQGLTTQELLALPTGPRERSAEELERDRGRLGGGFRSYGSNGSNSRYSNGDESSNSRWGSSRVSDDAPRRDSGPSRADEDDDWGAGKKSMVGTNSFDRRERGERGERGSGGGFFNSQSRADDSDKWGSSKSFLPSSEGRRFSSERKVIGFTSDGGADADNWGKNKKEESVVGGDRPRLNLQPRTLPVSNEKQEGLETVSKPIAPPARGANPFGAARPREDVLAEKGQDWKKIDEQLEAVKLKEVGQVADKLERKRSFGLGNGRVEDRTERTWRKPESSVDSRPQRFVELACFLIG
jgi:hypothetical protein